MPNRSSVVVCRKCGTQQIVVGTVQPCEECGTKLFDALPLSELPLFSKADRRFLKQLRIDPE